MANTADYTVTFRVTAPVFVPEAGTSEELHRWREAGVEHNSNMLDNTFGEFVRSMPTADFAILSIKVADKQAETAVAA